MIGRTFVDNYTLKLKFVVISDLGKGNYLVMNYSHMKDFQGSYVSVLTGTNIMSKKSIDSGYIDNNSPEYSKAVKKLGKSV